MEIRIAKESEIPIVKELIDSNKNMDTIEETFPKEYYERILEKGILLIAISDEEITGVCFGTYNVKEGWADLVGVVVKDNLQRRGIGRSLVNEFERISKEKDLKTIDLYAEIESSEFFDKLGFEKGRTYVAYRKEL